MKYNYNKLDIFDIDRKFVNSLFLYLEWNQNLFTNVRLLRNRFCLQGILYKIEIDFIFRKCIIKNIILIRLICSIYMSMKRRGNY